MIKKLVTATALAAFLAGAAGVQAGVDEAKKWVESEFQPSTLSQAEQMKEMEWFIKAAEPFKGMEINVLSEGIPTHGYESEVLTEAFEEIIMEIWSQPWLGNATTRQLIDELSARIEVDGAMEYRTVDAPLDLVGEDDDNQSWKALKGEIEFVEDGEEETKRRSFAAWVTRKRDAKRKDKDEIASHPGGILARRLQLKSSSFHETDQYVRDGSNTLEYIETEALLAALPGFRGGRLDHIADNLLDERKRKK